MHYGHMYPVQRDLGEPQDVRAPGQAGILDVSFKNPGVRHLMQPRTLGLGPWIFSPWLCKIETRMKIMKLCL